VLEKLFGNSWSQLTVLAAHHRIALIIFPLLATLFMGEVLFQDKSYSAFDTILMQSNWKSEYDYRGVHQNILVDSPTAHYPERKINWDLFRQGHNFNFTPYIFSGTNYAGRKIGAFVTSLPQLFLDVPSAIDWSIWFRLILAGLFMYLLLISLGVNKLGAVLAGVVWTYNMHQIVWLQFPQHLATQIWMPIILAINIRLLKDRFRMDLVIALLLANIFFYTSGYTQITLYYYLFIGLFNTLYMGFDRQQIFRIRFRKWIAINSIYIVAVSILVIDILIDLADIKLGLRGAQGFRKHKTELVLNFSLFLDFFDQLIPNLAELKRFFSPDYLGGIWDQGYSKKPYGNIVEGATYYGVVGLFLSFYAFSGIHKCKDKYLFYVLLGCLLLLVGFYYRDPIIMTVYGLIPFGGFGTYSRMMTVIIMVLAIFAALGLSCFLEDIKDKKYKKIIFLAILFVVMPVVARLLDSEFSIRKFAYAYSILAVFVGCVVIAMYFKRSHYIAYMAILVIAVDLFIVGYDFNTKMDNDRVFPVNTTVQKLLDDPDTFRVAVLAEKPIYHPNILTYYKIATMGGYLTVAPRDYINFIKKAYGKSHVTANGILFLFNGNYDFLRLMNVKYIVSDKLLDDQRLTLVQTGHKDFVYSVNNNLQRVYCASDYVAVKKNSKALPTFINAMEQYDRPVVANFAGQFTSRLTNNCTITQLKVFVDKLEFITKADEKTLITIPYNYHANWRATIDGQEGVLLRGNAQLMTLAIPEGEHEVKLLYQNDKEVYSSLLKIFVALLFIGMLLLRSRPGLVMMVMILMCILMVWKNSNSIPGIKNNDILEKPLREGISTEANDKVKKELPWSDNKIVADLLP